MRVDDELAPVRCRDLDEAPLHKRVFEKVSELFNRQRDVDREAAVEYELSHEKTSGFGRAGVVRSPPSATMRGGYRGRRRIGSRGLMPRSRLGAGLRAEPVKETLERRSTFGSGFA